MTRTEKARTEKARAEKAGIEKAGTEQTGAAWTRGGRVAVIGALGLAAVALAAGPAFAKGDVSIKAPHTAQVGKTFTVTAQGDDDAADYVRVCLEGRAGASAWHQVACGSVAGRGDGSAEVAARVKAERAGSPRYRAVVYGLLSPKDSHPVRERTSGVATVNVR
ncbi:hypothetical protein AB0A77_32985 [Streptomyces varsoviensis]|uniref:hypothetical protein n=1 Tax=Streptomyces varsoviensis TaxID=67373 RepID=UPI0033D9A744